MMSEGHSCLWKTECWLVKREAPFDLGILSEFETFPGCRGREVTGLVGIEVLTQVRTPV